MKPAQIVASYLPANIHYDVTANVISVPVNGTQLLTLSKLLYVQHKLPLRLIKAAQDGRDAFSIFYIFSVPNTSYFLVLRLKVTTKEPTFPSVVAIINEAASYEREIHTFFGLTPSGHPDLRPVILQENWPDDQYPLRKEFSWNHRPDSVNNPYDFHPPKGEGIYDVPLGPAYGGVTEPGHFRLSMLGEEVEQLELQLGYAHRGIEKLFEEASVDKHIELAEQVSGDTSFSHALAYCLAIEQLLPQSAPPLRAQYLRLIYSELERIANHCGNIGAILNDTGFIFGLSNGSRQREQIMQLCERLTNSRFLRGVASVGGVTKDIDAQTAREIIAELTEFKRDFEEWINITESTETVMDRLHTTGVLSQRIAEDHGVVGLVGRASGIQRDVRVQNPYAAYNLLPVKINIVHETTGDAYARYRVRVREVLQSISLVIYALKLMPAGTIQAPITPLGLAKNSYAIGLTEGWRGSVAYFVATDSCGQIARVGIRDASFLNWQTLPYAAPGGLIDFTITSSSFNLSPAAHDR